MATFPGTGSNALGVKVELLLVGSQAELERWLTTAIRKGARTRGGGSVERAYGAR
jgi:hypothetical protein